MHAWRVGHNRSRGAICQPLRERGVNHLAKKKPFQKFGQELGGAAGGDIIASQGCLLVRGGRVFRPGWGGRRGGGGMLEGRNRLK